MNIREYIQAFGTSEGVKKEWETRKGGSSFREKWENFLRRQQGLEDRVDRGEGRESTGSVADRIIEKLGRGAMPWPKHGKSTMWIGE